MGKKFTLLFIILLALASLITYVILTQKITAGDQQIADGKKQLEKGQQMLAEGKAKLAGGKQDLSKVKKVSNPMRSLPLMGMAIVNFPVTGIVYLEAKRQISEGDKLVEQGQASVQAGEKRLEAGKLALKRGKQRLNLANNIRIACAFGVVFFVSLAIFLGWYWRRSLIRQCRKDGSHQ